MDETIKATEINENWYYGQFKKLEGDEFTCCPTRLERDVLLEQLASKKT